MLAQSRLRRDARSTVPESPPASSVDRAAPPPAMLAALLALFAASGCGGADLSSRLARRASLAIGSSAMSLGVVLAMSSAARFGGLLGTRGAGRSPLRRYAHIELAIGVLGIVTLAPFRCSAARRRRSRQRRIVARPPARRCGARALAGHPAHRSHAAHRRGVGRRRCSRGGVDRLVLAANTIGGVLGASRAGFYLLRLTTLRRNDVAVALNLGVAAGGERARAPARGRRAAPTHRCSARTRARGVRAI